MRLHPGPFVRPGLLLAIVGAAAPSDAAGAESPLLPSVSAGQFLERLERHPRLAVVKARVEVARAEIAAARALPNPGIAYDRETVSVDGVSLPEDYLRAVLPLDLSGRRSRRIAAAEAGGEAAAASAEAERLQFRVEALSVFYDVAYARLRADILRADRDELGAILGRVRARAAAGDASAYDVTRLEIELGEHEDRLAEVERELAYGRHALGVLVGAAGPVDAADGLEVGAALAPATESRADVRAARLRRRQGEELSAAGRRALVPTLELSGGLKSVSLGDSRANGYLAGVSLQLPLFDRGQAEVARGESSRRLADAEARALEAAIPAEIEAARDRHARLLAQATAFGERQLPRADTLVRRAAGLYQEGERPIFELIDAHRTARQIRLRALELRRNARQSELELSRATGRLP